MFYFVIVGIYCMIILINQSKIFIFFNLLKTLNLIWFPVQKQSNIKSMIKTHSIGQEVTRT